MVSATKKKVVKKSNPLTKKITKKNRKGILLAAGKGTRLHPMTLAISKQLIPVYDKPMIYYPLSLFLHAGVRDILLIIDPTDLAVYKSILGDGSRFGVRLSYQVQIEKKGIADALVIAEKFLQGSPSVLILGDNLLVGDDVHAILDEAHKKNTSGALVFGYKVPDPERFGVVTFNKQGKVISLIEKPENPTSSYAVPGIYFYDEHAPRLAKTVIPSARGEMEITDLNRLYMEQGALSVLRFPENTKWFDTGTYDTLLEASNYIQKIQNERGAPIAHIESIAYHKGYIDKSSILDSAKRFSKTAYGQHLYGLINKSSSPKKNTSKKSASAKKAVKRSNKKK
jgi:glucose-1-phosphate thymidylyltransferase